MAPRPIDKTAVKVGFYRGEHFDFDLPEKIDGRRILTMETPPKRRTTPEGIRDYAGARNGRMTVLWYLFQKKPPRGRTTWLCRCDCGRYEYRQPSKFVYGNDANNEDCCQICHAERLTLSGYFRRPRSSDTHATRLLDWIRRMQELGLTDAEITDIHSLGKGLQTKDRTLEEIRADLDMLRQQASEAV